MHCSNALMIQIAPASLSTMVMLAGPTPGAVSQVAAPTLTEKVDLNLVTMQTQLVKVALCNNMLVYSCKSGVGRICLFIWHRCIPLEGF